MSRLRATRVGCGDRLAAIVGPSETVPVKNGRVQTGTWQQFVLCDFDDHPRERSVMVQVLS